MDTTQQINNVIVVATAQNQILEKMEFELS